MKAVDMGRHQLWLLGFLNHRQLQSSPEKYLLVRDRWLPKPPQHIAATKADPSFRCFHINDAPPFGLGGITSFLNEKALP